MLRDLEPSTPYTRAFLLRVELGSEGSRSRLREQRKVNEPIRLTHKHEAADTAGTHISPSGSRRSRNPTNDSAMDGSQAPGVVNSAIVPDKKTLSTPQLKVLRSLHGMDRVESAWDPSSAVDDLYQLLPEGVSDSWSRVSTHRLVTRVHGKARLKAFMLHQAKLPVPLEQLEDIKVTVAFPQGGGRFIQLSSLANQELSWPFSGPWRGYTVFREKGSDQMSGSHPSPKYVARDIPALLEVNVRLGFERGGAADRGRVVYQDLSQARESRLGYEAPSGSAGPSTPFPISGSSAVFDHLLREGIGGQQIGLQAQADSRTAVPKKTGKTRPSDEVLQPKKSPPMIPRKKSPPLLPQHLRDDVGTESSWELAEDD